jgi:hypothetical protein
MRGNDGFHSAGISMQELKTKTDKELNPLLILREGTYNPSLIFYTEARKPWLFVILASVLLVLKRKGRSWSDG